MSEAKPPESLLPYSDWAEEALRAVVREAVAHAAAAGLPGEHHFFITFRTDAPGVSLPTHLLARFPQEMTIVLQNKFWGLTVDRATDRFSVGLSFGGIPATLTIPFAAVTAFVDPAVNFGLRFAAPAAAPLFEDAPEAEAENPAADAAPSPPAAAASPQVVSLDAFRRKRD